MHTIATPLSLMTVQKQYCRWLQVSANVLTVRTVLFMEATKGGLGTCRAGGRCKAPEGELDQVGQIWSHHFCHGHQVLHDTPTHSSALGLAWLAWAPTSARASC